LVLIDSFRLFKVNISSISLQACQVAVRLAREANLRRNIKIDWRNLYSINSRQLQDYNFNFLATSAAHSELFNLKIILLALKLRISSVLCSQSIFDYVKALKLFQMPKRKESVFANGRLEQDPEADKNIQLVKRNVYFLDVPQMTEVEREVAIGIYIVFEKSDNPIYDFMLFHRQM